MTASVPALATVHLAGGRSLRLERRLTRANSPHNWVVRSR